MRRYHVELIRLARVCMEVDAYSDEHAETLALEGFGLPAAQLEELRPLLVRTADKGRVDYDRADVDPPCAPREEGS